MRVSADLHTHTTASDGQYSPTEVSARAKQAGIECLAITDHDTVDGVEEAVRAGVQSGIRILRGIELGAKEDRHLHILGLGLEQNCPAMETLCRKLRNSRNERKYRIVSFLAEKGIDIDLHEVEALAQGGLVARPHFAQIMVRHGYVSSMRDAFDRYLDTDEYQRIERFKADAATCIETIHRSGGKAVLAHPYQLNLPEKQLEDLLGRLKEAGLNGLECYYPQHTPSMVEQYLALAKKYDLYVTAGSDFHGEKVQPSKPLRPVTLELDWIFQQ